VKQKSTSFLWAHLALFIVNMLYGASHILAKGVMPNFLTPSVFILFRVFGASVLFWIVLSFARSYKIERKDWARLIGCGLFGVAVNQLFFFHGLNLSSSVNSGIIMAFNPIMVVILSGFLLKEKITPLRLTGIFIGAAGAVLLTLTGEKSVSETSLGDAFLLINSFSYAIYLVLAKPLMKKYSPLLVITWVFTLGLGFLFLYPPVLTEFYATNFSLGVNLFFLANKFLARLMNNYPEYNCSIQEIHHTEKKDAPSGTAITTAEGIVENHEQYEQWSLSDNSDKSINIEALRLPNVPGTHHVNYESDVDRITLSHEAKSRDGFALGSIVAAEWLFSKKGVYNMKDLLNFDKS